MIEKNSKYNPWPAEDEREHPSSAMEWWCTEAFLTATDRRGRWNVKTVFGEWRTKTQQLGSHVIMTLFDQAKKTNFYYTQRDDTARLQSQKDKFDIRFSDSWIKGSFPHYELHVHDPVNKIQLDMTYEAQSYPHWVAQNITDGWLPIGLGFYRYGFIPKCDITGTLRIQDKKCEIQGTGYFEHVWGDFTYHKMGAQAGGLKKSTATYAKLAQWWLNHNTVKIPKTITLSTENNPFGYDWIWAVLDNGWTLFYGNILFWIMQGPAIGSLILSKDGKTYEELGNVRFTYTKTAFAKSYDFQYPTEIELIAAKGNEKLSLTFQMTAPPVEHINKFKNAKYWLGFVICEAPGIVTGQYFDGTTTINLKGVCKIEPQRQVSALGHNTLRLDFLLPPEGVGITKNLESHFFGKKIVTKIQLAPVPKLSMSVKRIDTSKRERKR